MRPSSESALPVPPARPACPPPEARAWLDAAPAALAQVAADGRVVWANAAAARLLGTATVTEGTPLAAALGIPLEDTAPGAPAHARTAGCWLSLRGQPLADGTTLWHLADAMPEQALQDQLHEQHDLLQLATAFGRMGLWQRDPRTLTGRWDPRVFGFWGLDGDASTPDFDAAVRAIVPEDREALDAAFRASLRAPGTHAHRYRVRRRDGGISHLHSHWVVKPGPDGAPARVQGLLVDDTETLQSARRLDALASQLALAEDMAGLVLWRHDLATGRVEMNAQGFRVLGLPMDDAGLPIDTVSALVHPQDLPGLQAIAREALASGRPSDTEARYRQADGRWCHLLTRRVLERDEHGQPAALVGVALDVTARAQSLQRAQAQAQRFERTVRTAGIGYWALEPGDERAQWSEQMRALHGLPAGEPVPTLRQWLDTFVHPDDRVRMKGRFTDWLGGDDAMAGAEFRIRRRDGSERHLLTHAHQDVVDGQTAHYGLVIDVTDRRRTDLALRRAEQRAVLAARGAGLGTWDLDLATGESTWDETMWQLRGLPPRPQAPSPEELLRFVHPDDLEPMRARVALSSAGTAVLNHRFRVVWPDGSVHWLASRSAAVTDAEGKVVRRIGVNWDVTVERRAEDERRDRETAERANQAKSEFLARMSHELRTPLNAVLGFTQLLLSDPEAPPARRAEQLTHVLTAGKHLLSLIDDVLDLASVDVGQMRIASEPLALAAVVGETLPLLGALCARHEVTLHSAVVDGSVMGDRTRLRQVLLNLLSNAVKYNRSGGRVDLSARTEGGRVMLVVQDTGPGLQPAQLARLFEPFNRLGAERGSVEGTGIGLAISRALARHMGGQLDATSVPGRGSTFTLTLPAVPRAQPLADAAPAPAEAPADAGAAAAPSRTVLYIEDNAVNTMIVREFVALRPRVQLLTAADGGAGLALARSARPALVLLDMQLPDMDGLEVLQQLKAEAATAAIPVVALSANAMQRDIDRAHEAGLAAYWTKPIPVDTFLARLDALLGLAPAV